MDNCPPPPFTRDAALLRKSLLGLLQLTSLPLLGFHSCGFLNSLTLKCRCSGTARVPKGILPMSAAGTEPSTESPEDGANCGRPASRTTQAEAPVDLSLHLRICLGQAMPRVRALLHKRVCFWVCCPQVDNDSTDSTIHGGPSGSGIVLNAEGSKGARKSLPSEELCSAEGDLCR